MGRGDGKQTRNLKGRKEGQEGTRSVCMGSRVSKARRKRSEQQQESEGDIDRVETRQEEDQAEEQEVDDQVLDIEEEANVHGSYTPPSLPVRMMSDGTSPPTVPTQVPPYSSNVTTGTNNNHNDDPPPIYTYTDHRPNEGWSPKLVAEARKLRDDCNQASGDHDQAGYGHRTRHIIFGLPGPVVAVIVGGIAGLWESSDARYLITPLSMFGGIMTAVHIFLNMAGRAERHWAYAAHYGGLAAEIHHELQRDPRRRRESDEFFAEILTRIRHLNANAPQLPNKKKKGCKSACCGTGAYGGVNIIVEGGDDDGTRQELAEILERLRQQDRQGRTNDTANASQV